MPEYVMAVFPHWLQVIVFVIVFANYALGTGEKVYRLVRGRTDG